MSGKLSLTMESIDSLPYIDEPVSSEERQQIFRSIAAHLPTDYETKKHPSLPPLNQPKFTTVMQVEIDRKARGERMVGGIDMSRYEAPDEPTNEDDSQWRKALRQAYYSSAYLEGRHVNLSLLEEHGKNAWLVGNSQLEEMLRQVEKDLTVVKEETDNINKARKMAQEASRGELMALEEFWRTGVGKIIEVQVASDALRKEALRQRQAH